MKPTPSPDAADAIEGRWCYGAMGGRHAPGVTCHLCEKPATVQPDAGTEKPLEASYMDTLESAARILRSWAHDRMQRTGKWTLQEQAGVDRALALEQMATLEERLTTLEDRLRQLSAKWREDVRAPAMTNSAASWLELCADELDEVLRCLG